ncbi:hypothetical protein Q1695_008473 [Nippostrongylus brasiliensis]|nr:hypothetical protein Q1695_008473 [Nippostrongylus brasiliensis]
MDEFLSLCEAEEGEESLVEASDSYVTAPSECSMNRTEDLDSFMSAQSILLTPSGGSANVSGVSSHHDKTLTEMSIQERIQQLEEEKNRLIQQARETVFGSSPQGDTSKEKPVDNSSPKSDGAVQRTGFQLTQLDFESAPATNEPSTSKPSIDLGSDSDDEMMDHKRDLSESGKHLQKQLQKQERERATPWETLPSSGAADTTKKKPKENVLTGVSKKPKESVAPTLFDNFFRFNIRNPKISSSTFECYTDGHKRVRLSDVRSTTVPSADSWVTGGVVVARDVRKSANGKDYLIWKLHDLKDCQQPPVTLLLFGEAFKEYWKLQAGICVALMSPQLADTEKNAGPDKFKPKSSKVTLKVFKPAQVVELGYSSDLGTCKGVKLDGQRCSNFVNTSLSEFCVHHVMKEVRKLAANRGTFNSLTSLPPLKKPVNRLHNTTK